MAYLRVLPRDAFNEANFLKCIAQLTMDLEEGFHSFLTYHYDGEPFDLDQDVNGCLYITNMHFEYKGIMLPVLRPLNSRAPWPLYFETEKDSIPVFNENGEVVVTPEQLNKLI